MLQGILTALFTLTSNNVYLIKFIKFTNLTFRGTCIVMYSYNEIQRDALFLKFIW